MRKHRVAIIGCGSISGRYMRNLATFPHLEVAACADWVREAAEARAREQGIPRVCETEQILADDGIDTVINLTPPREHFPVTAACLKAGKHVYSEKPLALTLAQGKELLELARARGLRLGCAPDTFLGGGLQTCMKLIADGWIGRPLAATAFLMRSPPELDNPNVTFIYEQGAGPLFDMGPYYLTALVALLGPIRRVAAFSRMDRTERILAIGPHAGLGLRVESPTYLAGVIELAQGQVASLVTTFDCRGSTLPHMEIYGTEGTILTPDPNSFGGPVKLARAGGGEWASIPLTHRYSEEFRGLGAADMIHALQNGRDAFRANGERAYHVLEAMHGLLESAETGNGYRMESTCEKPSPMPICLVEGMVAGYPVF
jgi:predicted dehydrogenase